MNIEPLLNSKENHYQAVDSFVENMFQEYKEKCKDDMGNTYASMFGTMKVVCYELLRMLQEKREVAEINKRAKKVTLSQFDIEDCLLSIGDIEIPLTIEVKYKPDLIGRAVPLLKSVEVWAVLLLGVDIMDQLSTEEKYSLEEKCFNDYLKSMEESKTEFELRKSETA